MTGRLVKKKQHEQSMYHQDNLAKKNNPELALDAVKPDEIKIFGDNKYYWCKACNVMFVPYKWKGHVAWQGHIDKITELNKNK